MESTTPTSMPTQHECCSRKIRVSFVPCRNIEDGVRAIQEIQTRNLLCFHDVDQMNQIYRQVDLWERQVEQIPTYNSQHAFETIIERVISSVKEFGKDPVKDAKNLVSLYYLKNFSGRDLPIGNCFDSLFRKCKENPQIMRNIAHYLPICGSEARFGMDIKCVIGLNSDNIVAKILDQKKKTLQIIENKRLELKKWRENNPKDFPDYFDELLDGGYLHLYDHFIEMRALSTHDDRQSAIEKQTFSLLSHIVLETRHAIIKKVESSIPKNCQNVLFLLGGSGEGKSTIFCFLRGDEMVFKDTHYESKSDKNCLIGHEQASSCTFLPNIELVNDWAIVDFPGFGNSSGPFISLGIECALKSLITRYQPRILIIESITNIGGRFEIAAQLGSRLQRLLDNNEECILGITKYSRDPDSGQIRVIEEQQKKERLLPTPEETKLTTEINMLSSLNLESVQPIIKEKQQQLQKIQREKTQQLQEPLPETEEKINSKQNLQERENELLKQIGLAKIIRFDDLKDFARLPSCFKVFSQAKAIHVNLQHLLDKDRRDLLDHLFDFDLRRRIILKTVEWNYEFEYFKLSVKESSLINTIFSRSNPEIGEFLHLPEIDPQIVRNFDKKIVGSCIDKYMRSILKLDLPTIAFGKDQWASHFGDIGHEPPLPPDIHQILCAPCPFWPNKKVGETHMLVLIPSTVNGKPLTVTSLGELVKAPKQGNSSQYKGLYLGAYKDHSVPESYWALMTKDVLEGTRSLSYSDQTKIVDGFRQKTGIPYKVPHLIEAVVCLFMTYASKGIKLYPDGPWTYTRCKEAFNVSWQIAVGGFSTAGLRVYNYFKDSDVSHVGVGVVRKLPSLKQMHGTLLEIKKLEELIETPRRF